MKHYLLGLTFFFYAATTSFGSDPSILQFSSSQLTPEVGRKIMRMIIEAAPKGIFKENAESIKNSKNELAYTLASNGQGTSSVKKPKIDFSYTSVNLKTGQTSTSIGYEGKGYAMILTLDMSYRLLTEKGKHFFRDLARKQGNIIS